MHRSAARVRGAPSNGGAVVRLEDSADVLVVVETSAVPRHREEEDVERVVGGRRRATRMASAARSTRPAVAVRGVHLNARHLDAMAAREKPSDEADRRATPAPPAHGIARAVARALDTNEPRERIARSAPTMFNVDARTTSSSARGGAPRGADKRTDLARAPRPFLASSRSTRTPPRE